MSNLRLINETTGSSVSSLSIPNCFSADYDIYQVQINVSVASGNNNINARLLNSSGSQVSTSTYELAGLNINAFSSFAQDRETGNTSFHYLTQVLDSNDSAVGNTYFFNPNNASYTFVLSQQANITGTDFRSRKQTQVEKSTTQATGLYLFTENSGTVNLNVSVYGLRVDS